MPVMPNQPWLGDRGTSMPGMTVSVDEGGANEVDARDDR